MKCSEVTIVSIDAVAMYPSIKFRIVKKAINFYATKAKLPKKDDKTILQYVPQTCQIRDE